MSILSCLRGRFDAINFMMEDLTRRGRHIPLDLRVRVRSFFRSQRDLARRMTYEDLANKLSPALRLEIKEKLSRGLLSVVWFFNGCQEGFMEAMLERVEKRPFLFEQASVDVAVERAKMEAHDRFDATLRKHGLADKLDPQ